MKVNLDKKNFISNTYINSSETKYFTSSIYIVLKICFFLLSIVSLFRIGFISKIRLTRLREIQDSYTYEESRFNDLTNRFDDLFSFKGEQRFMKDQQQMISRDIIRVIWP